MKVAKIEPDAFLPTRKFYLDAGMDLYSYQTVTVKSLTYKIIHTKVFVEIPKGCVGQIWPKGKSNHLIGAGIVDEGYQGEILVKVFNPTNENIEIKRGDAIAQMVILPVLRESILPVEKTQIFEDDSERKATGGIVVQVENSNKLTDFKMTWD